MALPFVQTLAHGVHVIDTGFHRPLFDASYLIVENGRAAFVDTGTNFAVPRLLAALEDLGLGRDAVDFVIPTHVHLDHAGGAGLLMQSLPQARMLVHPRGARHMIDPQALYAGALAVYGQAAMDRDYGNLVPVPADRVLATEDGMTVELAGRPLHFIDTPGHDGALSQAGHTYADVLVTPINDSLIDLDVLAHFDPHKQTIHRPSHYSERVWKAKQARAKRDGGSMDWIVVRNRLGQLEARNKKLMQRLVGDLAKRIGFRMADGIHERVIYRELFLEGLTAEDLAILADTRDVSMSHVAARQEIRNLIRVLGLSE